MRRQWSGAVALSLSALAVTSGIGAHRTNAAPAPAAALAYVADGQVVVIESGSLTVAGPGQSPVWSPSGANLLFDTPDMLGNNATLYISDTHGANTRPLVSHAYPALNPSWSADSKYVVYTVVAPGTSATGRTVQLQVKATRIADGSSKILGKFSFAAGCSVNATALQIAFAKAQGSYRGTPSTLIWAQPSTVVAQSSCTGQGLTVFRVGKGGAQTLAGWSGGSLSPDGKTVVADVAGAGSAAGRVGVISVATGATKLLAPKLSPGSFAWLANSKVFYTVGQPANPNTGSSTIYRISPDGKHVSSLGSVKAAGVFHLSLNHLADHLAMAVVANAPSTAVSPPTTMVYDASAYGLTPTVPLIGGVQPAWRP